MGTIAIKRVYDLPAPDDGQRVLVDRLWPRGVSKDRAALSEWFKDIAPSTQLRKWFAHDPANWGEFQQLYRQELDTRPDAVAHLCDLAAKGKLTLIYAAHDPVINHAGVLRDYLQDHCS